MSDLRASQTQPMLKDPVRYPVDPGRQDRLWARIEPRVDVRRAWWASRELRVGLAAFAVLLLVVGVLWRGGDDPAPPEASPETHEAHAMQPAVMRLPGVGRVELGSAALVEPCEILEGQDACLEVEAGRATFEVTRKPGRDVAVHAGRVTVHVIGTRFVVARRVEDRHEVVRVEVERGEVRVEVEGDDTPRTLRAGESWSGRFPLEEEHTALDPMEASVDPEVVEESPEDAASTGPETGLDSVDPEVVEAPPEVAAAPRRPRRRVRSRPAPKPEVVEPTSPSRDLWAEVKQARRGRRYREAATLYEEILASNPPAASRALASFDLGRLRMDELEELEAAAEMFERVLKTRYADDALARLVLIWHRLGRKARCTSARDQYLERFPDGPHARAVRGQCSF